MHYFMLIRAIMPKNGLRAGDSTMTTTTKNDTAQLMEMLTRVKLTNEHISQIGDKCAYVYNATESNPILVENWPYGRLRTTMKVYIELKAGKARSVWQTLNPKNGRWNAPKKSTYNDGFSGLVISLDNDSDGPLDRVGTFGCSLTWSESEKIRDFVNKHGEYMPESYKKEALLLAQAKDKYHQAKAQAEKDFDESRKEVDLSSKELWPESEIVRATNELDLIRLTLNISGTKKGKRKEDNYNVTAGYCARELKLENKKALAQKLLSETLSHQTDFKTITSIQVSESHWHFTPASEGGHFYSFRFEGCITDMVRPNVLVSTVEVA